MPPDPMPPDPMPPDTMQPGPMQPDAMQPDAMQPDAMPPDRASAHGTGAFDDVMAGNRAYSQSFSLYGLQPVARRGLAVVTCMDSRIEPLAMLGLAPGDAKIMRNAGARVTDDVLRTLVLATHLLGVDRIMVVPHTQCKMGSATQAQIVQQVAAHSGIDVTSISFGVVENQRAALVEDVERIRHWPFFPGGVRVGGFLYNVGTGALDQVL